MDSIWIIALIVLAILILQKLPNPIRKKKSPLPPGPRGLPVLGHLHMLGKNPHQDLHHLAKKHGPIMHMRFGLVPAVIVSSPDAAEQFLKTHDLVFASRPYHEGAQYVGYGQKNLTFGKYGAYWRNMRKLCILELLSNAKIRSFESMRREELKIFVESIRKAAADGLAVDVSAKVANLNANIVCLMVFGKKYAEDDFNEKGFKAVVQEAMELGATPNLGDYFPFLGVIDLQGLTRRMKALSKVFDEFLEKIIDEHVQNREQTQKKDFVDTMLAIMESGSTEFQFDRRHIKAVLLDMFVAGMDTSATTVEWVLSELLRHPQVMKKVRKELEETVGMNRAVKESDLEKLEYLKMVVKETFRLHPVAPLLLPHESTEDCTVNGFHIPKRSRILINTWAIGKDPDAWPEPEKFVPERFVGSNIDVRGRNFQLLPFGSGRRMCPGVELGLIFVHLILAQLLHSFDWELPDGMKPSDLDMTERFGLATGRANHLVAVPNYRLHN